MTSIEKNEVPQQEEINNFLKKVDFELPLGFIDFFKQSNGADINLDDGEFILFWPITEMFELNEDYNVNLYAPGFFLFGSNGGETAYAIEKQSGFIFEIPFVPMSIELANLKSKTFTDFIK
jgi:hypothetical protein